MMSSDCDIGDLIMVTHDCYIFMNDKAFMIHKNTSAVIIQILDEDKEFDAPEFSAGRRKLWMGSLKISDEFGREGWIHAANVIKI